MQTLCRIAFVVLCSGLPSAVLADGLIYQLPPDGTWVRFQADVTVETPNGKVVTMTGSNTLSSVGVAEVDGEVCRWIETSGETRRDDLSGTLYQKLLIPEKYLEKGQDPLAHVRKAWFSHPQVANGTAQEIQVLEEAGRQQVNAMSLLLHGPGKNSKPLGPLEVTSKLGKLECAGITAQQKTEPEPNVILDTTNTTRLHPSAPFGVVTFESTTKVKLNKMAQGTKTLKLKLVASGKDAKSKLPDSK